ncbi:hypothetical protein [Magpiepox virus 2]|nr:hypothetical protein [Magpiepox virus 2]
MLFYILYMVNKTTLHHYYNYLCFYAGFIIFESLRSRMYFTRF